MPEIYIEYAKSQLSMVDTQFTLLLPQINVLYASHASGMLPRRAGAHFVYVSLKETWLAVGMN